MPSHPASWLPRLAFVAALGSGLAAIALPAMAQTSGDILFQMRNARSDIASQHVLVNEGKTVWLRPGQVETIRSSFFAWSSSTAVHTVRIQTNDASPRRLCEWRVNVSYNRRATDNWSCGAVPTFSAGNCEGYPTSRQGEKCTFNFVLTR